MFVSLLQALEFHADETALPNNRGRMTREKVIDAAVAIFALKGYQQATTHEIAAASGTNQGLITYHFGSKLNLWKRVIDNEVGRCRRYLVEQMRNLARNDEVAFFKHAIGAFVHWTAHNPDATRLLLEANRSGSEVAAWCAERHMKPIFGVFSALIADGQKRGFVRDGEIIHIYYQIISTAMVFTIPEEVRLLSGQDVSSDCFIDNQTALLLSMLLKSPT
jgi:TetR/AcrR family transcriptional regulator